MSVPSQVFVTHETLPSQWTTGALLPGESKQIAPGLWISFSDEPYNADGILFPMLVVSRDSDA